MRLRMLGVAALALAAASCTSFKPLPVQTGDVCFRCRRTIVEPKLAAEMIDSGGRAFKFRTAGCLATYLKQHPEETGTIFVTDYPTGRMLKASSATFVPTVLVDGFQKTREFVAFNRSADAQAAAQREGSTPVDWEGVLAATN